MHTITSSLAGLAVRHPHFHLAAGFILPALVLGLLLAGSPTLSRGAESSVGESAGKSTGAESDVRPAVRVLKLRGVYVDHPTGPGFDPMTLLMGNLEPPASFVALCDRIDELAVDDAIQHLFLDLSDPGLGLNLAQLTELGRRLESFRSGGKKVFAWIENAGFVHYTLAAGCDAVMMSDPGMLDFPSLSLTTLYFNDALKLLGAEASYTRSGDYKGAVEPFSRSEMSPELRAHYLELVRGMNDALVRQVARGR